MAEILTFTLSFGGSESDEHVIDFYDVSQALIAFQRTLALTTHLVLNDEIITQAPALKGAQIYAVPAEAGSWKFSARVMIGLAGLYHLGTAQNNTPLGHLVFSVYDYVISESLGVHVDYNKSIGQLCEEAKARRLKEKKIQQVQADSLVEKCSNAIKEMHRPIYKSRSATHCVIFGNIYNQRIPVKGTLDSNSYEFITETFRSKSPEAFIGSISSYNSNTYKGRIYIPQIGRPISFELEPSGRNKAMITLITSSLSVNALRSYSNDDSFIGCVAVRNTSKSGYLKSLSIMYVAPVNQMPKGSHLF